MWPRAHGVLRAWAEFYKREPTGVGRFFIEKPILIEKFSSLEESNSITWKIWTNAIVYFTHSCTNSFNQLTHCSPTMCQELFGNEPRTTTNMKTFFLLACKSPTCYCSYLPNQSQQFSPRWGAKALGESSRGVGRAEWPSSLHLSESTNPRLFPGC